MNVRTSFFYASHQFLLTLLILFSGFLASPAKADSEIDANVSSIVRQAIEVCPEITQENPVGVISGEAAHNIGKNVFRAGPAYWLSGIVTERNFYLFTATGVKSGNQFIDLKLKSKTALTSVAFEQWARADRLAASIYKFTESGAIWQFDQNKYTDVMLTIRWFCSWNNQKMEAVEFVNGKGKAVSKFENCVAEWRERAKNTTPQDLPATPRLDASAEIRRNENADASPRPVNDIENSLRQLQKLKDGGLLTEDEFQKKRSEILKRL